LAISVLQKIQPDLFCMSSTNENRPGFVILTSAMRTGSTWLVNLLKMIAQAPHQFVNSVEEALAFMEKREEGAVFKTHGIVDLDWPRVPAGVPMVRIIRNFKDSLISRALYVKNIRTSEGSDISEPEMRALLAELGTTGSEQEFIRAFMDRCPLVEDWLAEIAVLERGKDKRCLTLMYEALMHNPYDVVAELTEDLWPGWSDAKNRVRDAVRQSIRNGFHQRETFLRSHAVGVGGWETWLSCEQSERLDDLFAKLRGLAGQNPGMRWQEVLQAHRTNQSLQNHSHIGACADRNI
jgi:hypothetical protein